MSDSKIDMHLPGIFSTVHLRTYWCVARRAISLVSAILLVGCRANDLVVGGGQSSSLPARFGNRINLNQIPDYGSQSIPAYIQRRNSALAISNEKALLGRVLFYDTRLSTNNRVSCASCHQQQFAFSDTSPASLGVNGRTARHSMRLVNVRFAEERRFFWDERAATLSDQLLQPVQDHVEMGFSGTGGNPGLTDLMSALQREDYYRELFQFVYKDPAVTSERVRESLLHFVSSIQSFDSRYDEGRAMVTREVDPFPTFSASENRGKSLFVDNSIFAPGAVRIGGGLGCGICHRPPEFDMSPASLNNGFIEAIGGGQELRIVRAPTLRDLMRPDGSLNGKLMHTGSLTLRQVLEHYNSRTALNANLDPRLRPEGRAKDLRMNAQEFDDMMAFMRTLSGARLYSDPKWSDPFIR